MNPTEALIEVDWGAFDPWAIAPERHRLTEHPLLQMPALLELGQQLEARHGVRTHSNAATAGTPFNHAPGLHPNRTGATATLSHIAEAKAWMSMLNVQGDPVYRGLVDEVLDDPASGIARRDPGMCCRSGWIFVTSPHTVTPFHFDKEHNFILQVRGRKTLYVWEPHDTVAASEAAHDLFHASHSRARLRWDESLRALARVFQLEPGMGACMPSTSPHLVQNGDEPSTTVSSTCCTEATRRDALLHRAHERLCSWGYELPPIRRNVLLHTGLLAVFRGASLLRQWRASLARVPQPRSDRASYACAGGQ